MRWSDVAYLIIDGESEQLPNGYEKLPEPSKREVFVNVKSIGRTEFFMAKQSGVQMKDAFEIRVCDFNDEKQIMYGDRLYNIERTYSKDGEIMELNCSEAKKGAAHDG